jgi:predicted RND superfamily exporter protein
MPSLSLQADFRSMASELPAYEDASHVERVMGSSGEVMVALSGEAVVDREVLTWMRETSSTISVEHGDDLRPVVSVAALLDFLGQDPSPSQLEAALRLLPPYLLDSVLAPGEDRAVMAYGVDVGDVEDLQRLREDLEGLLAGAPSAVDVQVTGLPMVAVSAYEALDQDRFLTAALGILAAGVVLLLLLPRRRIALLAMLSAATTSGVVLLAMAALGLALSPITAGVGSLTAAVACEFTVVLAHALERGDRRIARAVDLAAAASATGYAVLAVSDLSLIRGFGLLLAATVVLALGVSRLLVWALLARDVESPDASIEEPSGVAPRSLMEVGA